MTFLLRVWLADRPGSLGALATALGQAGADIVSLDVVERTDGGAVDDILVALPPGGLADVLITAAHSVPGVSVESLRPYLGGQEMHRDVDVVDAVASRPQEARSQFVAHCPGVFRAGWAILVHAVDDTAIEVTHASAGAPDLAGITLPWLPLTAALALSPGEDWVPERWRLLGLELAAAPLGRGDIAVLIGRPGGPRFRPSEVLRLAHLAGLVATVQQVHPA